MSSMVLPRPEYPRPQMVRDEWINLNGRWRFCFDFGNSGIDRKVESSPECFDREIIVPFCPESELSGIGYRDFMAAVYYRREIEIPAGWSGKRILIHFGAVDTIATVYIDGAPVTTHYGGMTGFTADVTGFVTPGRTHVLVVRAEDDLRSGNWGGGKQSHIYRSHGCHYTRVTGIWQTVWMEPVAMTGFKRCYVSGDPANGSVTVSARFHAAPQGLRWRVAASLRGIPVGAAEGAAGEGATLTVPLSRRELWEPGNPVLYDLEFTLVDGKGAVVDRFTGYTGLRSIEIRGNKFYLNGRELFQRLVLDQGYYPDGIWTAPSDAALKYDIELAMKAGFNGARLHQKVFEERYLYWADKLGYLTWGESSSWGLVYQHAEARYNFLRQWLEIVDRLKDHPSIIVWTPLNETAREGWSRPREEPKELYHRWVIDLYDVTRQLDPTRPVNDSSGWCHAKTDLWTVHPYRPGAKEFRETIAPADGGVMVTNPNFEVPYQGQPYLIDEFGGFKYTPSTGSAQGGGWGYHGIEIKDGDAFCDKIREQVEVMLADERVAGYCYTQLTDVEQEQNGICFYDRTPKVPLEQLAAIFGRSRDTEKK